MALEQELMKATLDEERGKMER
jgi:hypothetical protein